MTTDTMRAHFPYIRLVVFDLGGVMINLADGWQGACALSGHTYRQLPDSPSMTTRIHELDCAFNAGALLPAEFYQAMSDAMLGSYTPDEVAAIYQAIIQEEFPGIHDTVQALQRAGYHTACLSNTCGPHWVDLTNPQRYPGIAALDFQHASHLFRVAKPDHRIYRCFEEATQSQPAQILFFDDRLENILAARECGWNAVHITTDTPSVEQIHAACAANGITL